MYNERLRHYGATLSAAAALGGFAVTSAEAKPAEVQRAGGVTHIEAAKLPQNSPEGVHVIIDGHKQQLEAQYAIEHLTKRLDNVVLELHAPKKNAYVVFATSPSSYVQEGVGLGVLGSKTTHTVIAPNPGIVKLKTTGREYAVVYDTQSSNWAFLDIAYAQEVGALDIYTIKGKKPALRNMSMGQSEIPYIFDSLDYGPDWTYDKTNREDQLLGIYLPINTDPHRKYYRLSPAKALPTH